MSRSNIKRLFDIRKFMTSEEPHFLVKEHLDGAQRYQKGFAGNFLGKNGRDTLDHFFRHEAFNKVVKSKTGGGGGWKEK